MRVTLIENFRAVFYAPFYAAISLGTYEAEGLDIVLEPSPDAARTARALIDGSGDVAWGGPLRLMMALEARPGGEAIAFCEAVGRDPFFLLGREPDPGFSVRSLTGRRLAVVTEVPTPWLCLRHDLRLAGIAPESIEVVRGRTMPENVAALRSGEADVIQVFHPLGAGLVREGSAHVLYAAASRGPTSYTTLNTTRAYAARHPEVLHRMCRAMHRTLGWIAAHDGAALAALLSDWLPDVPAPVLSACFENYKALGLWNRTPVLQRDGLAWLQEAAIAGGAMKRAIAYDDCVDMQYAEAAVREDPPPPLP